MEKTVILFLDVEKYPPSLQFLLMTLGPGILLLALAGWEAAVRYLQTAAGLWPRADVLLRPASIRDSLLAVLMAVVFHQPVEWLLHGAFMMNCTPDGYGHGLPFIYLIWMTVLVILYFPCGWFMGVKQRRKDWWLSYL